MNYDEAADALEETLRVLDERGWVKDTAMDHKGHVCVGRAITVASERLGFGTNITLARQFLEMQIGSYPISTWNDRFETTFEDVQTKLKEAAQGARAYVSYVEAATSHSDHRGG